ALEAKFSRSEQQTFHRLKVRIKREIVTMGCPTVKPAEQVGTYVPPQQWDALIRDPSTLVVDTRNAYEVAVGSFEGAIDPGTESFREFPAWVERELRPLVEQRRPKAIAMFCTGGIRCEKSTAYLLQQGFENVHHLQGGILRYLEEMPEQESSWQGECYVFDQRVSVNHQLQPGSYRLCHACGLPVSPSDCEQPSYREGVSCPHCIDRFSDADRERFAERQKQMQLARRRGEQHLG
ncbi:MAG: rhodanese-related sulfurtransferase, partial [Vulcanococcus sp.]